MTDIPLDDASLYETLSRKVDDLERIVNDLRYGGPLLDVQISLQYLLMLSVQQRKRDITDRISTSLAFEMNSQTKGPKARLAHMRLMEASNWFEGALQETESPIAIFQEWLERLKKSLAQQGYDNHFRAFDELPPAPQVTQDL